MADEVHGIENPAKVDLVALAATGECVELVMVQTADWDGSDRLLLLLQEKWKNYLSFAADGQLVRSFPEYAELPWRLVLDCQSEPDDRTADFVHRAHEVTRTAGGEFVIRRLFREQPSGH
jgi:hypothetical protein